MKKSQPIKVDDWLYNFRLVPKVGKDWTADTTGRIHRVSPKKRQGTIRVLYAGRTNYNVLADSIHEMLHAQDWDAEESAIIRRTGEIAFLVVVVLLELGLIDCDTLNSKARARRLKDDCRSA